MTSLDFLLRHLVVPFQSQQPGYQFSYEWAHNIISDSSLTRRKTLRNPMTISTILRLLRFLDNSLKDTWLSDIFMLIESSRKNVALIAALPDWQPSLFPLISETLESVSTAKVSDHLVEHNLQDQDISLNLFVADPVNNQKIDLLQQRLDRCLSLYSTLLGHSFREGGDQVSPTYRPVSFTFSCILLFSIGTGGFGKDDFAGKNLCQRSRRPAVDSWKPLQ
jgi:hypothetical protein